MRDNKELLELGNKLAAIRLANGMSKSAFAREAKVDVPHYLRIENGDCAPGFFFLKKIIKRYSIDANMLFSSNGTNGGVQSDERGDFNQGKKR